MKHFCSLVLVVSLGGCMRTCDTARPQPPANADAHWMTTLLAAAIDRTCGR